MGWVVGLIKKGLMLVERGGGGGYGKEGENLPQNLYPTSNLVSILFLPHL